MGDALARWRADLAAWAIPDRILAAVADSPWTVPTGVFARRARHQVAEPSGVSWELAWQALAPPGSVLDVGAGAGAASLPLAARTTELTAVDVSASMLDELRRGAEQLGLTVHPVLGRWPEVAAPTADVVVCHHVAYNVPELDAFALALHEHARRRVVIELTALHPLSALNPLWTVMHGITRPSRPTAADAEAVLREAGLHPQAVRWPRPARPEYPSFDELVHLTRQRLCLPPARDKELAEALVAHGADPEHPRDLPMPDEHVVTLWWDV